MTPIDQALPEILARLGEFPAVILTAPPGSGKTTRVPLALMDAPWLGGESILMLEPRRLAARAAARHMAHLLGEPLGQRIGYQVRFERRVSRVTRIEIVTEGILTRRLQADPGLSGVGLVVFDEFHERSLHADLGLALCRELQGLRDDLRLLVMSATLESEGLSSLLGGAPVIDAPGAIHPVTVNYLPREPDGRLPATVAGGIRHALMASPGDLLAFLPGGAEIRQSAANLASGLPESVELLTLHGELPRSVQDRVIAPAESGPRRVILATDIAETSLTIPGVSIVVDGGFRRRPRFHPGSGLTRLETTRISRASADQRAGRAGRLGPGVCWRLWSVGTQQGLVAAIPAEILEADLAALLLELAIHGVSDPDALPWLDPPPAGAVAQAREMLLRLEAVGSDGRMTQTGRAMARLPLHPRLAHMILTAADDDERARACDLAAILAERDPLMGRARSVDIAERMQLLDLFRRRGPRGVRPGEADPAGLARLQRASAQIRRLAGVSARQRANGDPGLLLAAAFPDRIAQARVGQRGRFRLSSGRGATLPASDPLAAEPLLAAAALDGGQIEGRIYLAAQLEEGALRARFAHLVKERAEVTWDGRGQRVVAQRVEALFGLTLRTRPLERPDREAVRAAMLDGVRMLGLAALPWSRKARALQARVGLLAMAAPDLSWPDLSDGALLATLGEWLGPFLDGCTRRAHLERLDLIGILMARLDWPQRQALEREAPTHFQAPSGSRLRIDYAPGAPPALEARVQELFGLNRTPAIGQGRVPLLLRLLSPARRPLQITDDLPGFWAGAWSAVRKEMKGRYPKHHWPEDPARAQPTAGVRPKKSSD